MKLKVLTAVLFLLASFTLHSQNIDSLLVVARNTKNDSVSISKLNIAGYFCIFRDADKAYKILHEARKKAIRTKRNYNYVEVSNTLGVYHDMTGSKDSAGYYFDKALQMSRKNRYLNLQVRSTNNLGMLNWNRGRFNDALSFFLKALEINENVPEGPTKTSKSTMYSNIGLIYQEMNLYEKALGYHKMAYDFRILKNRRQELSTSLNNMGICYERLGRRAEAVTSYKEGLRIAKEFNPVEYYKILENYSGILIEQEQYNEAVAYLLESLNRPPEILMTSQTKLFIYAGLANAYVNLQQPDVAVKYGTLGLGILEQEPDLAINSGDVYMSLSRAYYMLGDIDKGHTYSEAFGKTTRDRFSSENASEIAKMEVKYETAKKEKVIAESRLQLLRAEAEAHNMEIQIAENEAMLLRNEVDAEKKEKLIAMNRAKLLKSEAESGRKGKLIAENRAKLLETEAEVRNKNYMFMISLCFIGFLSVIGYLIYRQQRLRTTQLEKEFELKTALALIENQNKLQEQRLTISRDLHDNIGAQLTFIISTLDSLKYRLHDNIPAVGNKLEGISNFTRQTIIELRDTIWAMNTKHITFEDLRVRILNFLEKAQEANEDINFEFKIDPTLIDLELSSVTGMNVYRTIQEAINNTIKHSDATTMEIIVFDDSNAVSIIIRDNGKGFDRANILPGNGLQNMEKRIEDIGGTLNFTSGENEGTLIEIHLQKQVQSA